MTSPPDAITELRGYAMRYREYAGQCAGSMRYTYAGVATELEERAAELETVAAVAEHVALTERGHTWLGLCPFHDESRPSFNVRPKHRTYHCFGCGGHGSIADLLRRIGEQQ